MRGLRNTILTLAILAVLALGALLLWSVLRGRPQDLPWTPLDLSQPVGMFTGRKLAGLTDDFGQCRAHLDKAGVRYTVLPVTQPSAICGYADGVRLLDGGARRIGFAPAGLGMACPVAAALAVWEWEVLQPAARREFGQAVASIDHFGSYSCRRLYSRDAGAWSEHATADAVDVAGFRLADGTRISVIGDWAGSGPKARFLRDVRDGACDLFATVLSPDYNAAHRDHLHLDQAERGEMGWRACR